MVIHQLSIEGNLDLSDAKVVRDNLVSFELFFEDLSYTMLEEDAAYTVGNNTG